MSVAQKACLKNEMNPSLSGLQTDSDLSQKVSLLHQLSNLISKDAGFEGWIKVKGVLFRDPHDIAIDQAAEARNLGTTDEVYISDPEEAVITKSALVSLHTLNEIPEIEALLLNTSEIETGNLKDNRNEEVPKKILVEEVISSGCKTSLRREKQVVM
jgi:hypothetical protein